MSCLKGCVPAGANRQVTSTACTKAAKQYDYSSFKPAFDIKATTTAASAKNGRKLSAGSA